MKPSAGLHPQAHTKRSRAAFREVWPSRELTREAEISALPTVEWKGKTLHTLRCRGLSGKGPHNVHVPEGLCWALIALDEFRCPYHANSEMAPAPERREEQG